jgi:hypothetical protein
MIVAVREGLSGGQEEALKQKQQEEQHLLMHGGLERLVLAQSSD